MFMADRIALMREGQLVQLGTPEELYLQPANPFVATFLGEVNRLPARIRDGQAVSVIGCAPAAGLAEGSAAELLLRPEGLRVLPAGHEGSTLAEVEACRLLGATTLVHMAVTDGEGGVLHLHARLPPGAILARGQMVGVALDPGRAFAFPRMTGGDQGATEPLSA